MPHYQDSISSCQQLPVYDFNHNTDMETIAERLKAERVRQGLSQDDLANKCRIGQSFIGALESGNQKSSGWLPEIAHALGVNAYWLKTGKGSKSVASIDITGINQDLSDKVQWIINNADDDIRTMFGLMVQAVYLKKQAEINVTNVSIPSHEERREDDKSSVIGFPEERRKTTNWTREEWAPANREPIGKTKPTSGEKKQ